MGKKITSATPPVNFSLRLSITDGKTLSTIANHSHPHVTTKQQSMSLIFWMAIVIIPQHYGGSGGQCWPVQAG